MTALQNSALVEQLRFNLQEKSAPFFTEDALLQLLAQNGWDLAQASYAGCLLKAENDAIQLPELSLPDNQAYWRRLALVYRPNRSAVLGR